MLLFLGRLHHIAKSLFWPSVIGSLLAGPASAQQTAEPTKTLVAVADLKHLHEHGKLDARGMKLTFTADGTVLELTRHTAGLLIIRPEDSLFDAGDFTRTVVELKNLGAAEVKYEVLLENPNATGKTNFALGISRISPGQAKNSNVYFQRNKSAVLSAYPEMKVFLPMKAFPTGLVFDEHNIEPAKIQSITLTIPPSDADVKLLLGNIYASHPAVPPLLKKGPDAFFPFIDAYGQYKHEDWPGKVTRDEELKEATRREEEDLEKHGPPANRSKYGGWTAGPHLEATGFFRVAKHEQKWWLVDPEGYLFWSYGATCFGAGGADTSLVGRERFFSGLPEGNSPLAQFYGKDYAMYMFSQSNMYRKYGVGWLETSKQTTHRRIKSWGMNTMGAWSNPGYTSLDLTPYTVAVDYKGDTVTARRFPDVFSPAFRENVRQTLETRAPTFNDPWCIGFFIDNELKFGEPLKFVKDLFADPKTTPCKTAWVEELKQKYSTIADFNRVTGANIADWDALRTKGSTVNPEPLSEVADTFYRKMCRMYFETCRDELKKLAPHHLYLGCRFLQNTSKVPISVAAEYCDVVSFNVYDYSVADRRIEGVDKPFIVGEFHFGALDRGMFGTGGRGAGDQQDRAGLFEDYVTGALGNPYCVGTHWFQYNSQPFTGRNPDGENFQIGLLDITGNPYPEIRAAIRKVGGGLYETRVHSSNGTTAVVR